MSQFIAAPFTPFDSRGDLALDAVEQQAEHLIRTGIVGAFVCGTTGESSSLTMQERMDLAQRWVDVAGADLRVFVHTGHNALREAQALGRHAAALGAYATAALPPTYFKPDSLSTLVHCCGELASSAPGLPFFYYHIPVLSGINFSAAAFVEAAADRIDNLAGIKFTHGDLPDFQHANDLAGGATAGPLRPGRDAPARPRLRRHRLRWQHIQLQRLPRDPCRQGVRRGAAGRRAAGAGTRQSLHPPPWSASAGSPRAR